MILNGIIISASSLKAKESKDAGTEADKRDRQREREKRTANTVPDVHQQVLQQEQQHLRLKQRRRKAMDAGRETCESVLQVITLSLLHKSAHRDSSLSLTHRKLDGVPHEGKLLPI